jgi:hypothetical protein
MHGGIQEPLGVAAPAKEMYHIKHAIMNFNFVFILYPFYLFIMT